MDFFIAVAFDKKQAKDTGLSPALLYPENHAIVAWFKKAIAYKENANKKSEKNVFVSKAPSERDLAPKATEGECEMSMGQLQ